MKLLTALTIFALSGFEMVSAVSQVLPNGWPIIFHVAKQKGLKNFNNKEINARAGRFWATKSTKGFCSEYNKMNCPEVLRTVFAPLQNNGELRLGSYIPNANPAEGQQVYVDSDFDMHFTSYDDQVPKGAITKFDLSSGALKAINGSTQLNTFLCPFDSNLNFGVSFFQGTVMKDCAPVELTPNYAYGAYEYR